MIKRSSNFYSKRRVRFLFLISVIIICDRVHYRDIMVRACVLNMCNGEYVFLVPSNFEAENFEDTKPWQFGDDKDEAAQHAFTYLLYVSSYLIHCQKYLNCMAIQQ